MEIVKKIGLYAGTFNPVHEGHIMLMARSIERLNLDMVYCLPDRYPARKTVVTSLANRRAMLELATATMDGVKVVELRANYATFPGAVDELRLNNCEVYILMGSDTALGIGQWENSQQMIDRAKLIVGVRDSDESTSVEAAFKKLGVIQGRYSLIRTQYTDFSSSKVRRSLQQAHPKIVDYIRNHRLYKV